MVLVLSAGRQPLQPLLPAVWVWGEQSTHLLGLWQAGWQAWMTALLQYLRLQGRWAGLLSGRHPWLEHSCTLQLQETELCVFLNRFMQLCNLP